MGKLLFGLAALILMFGGILYVYPVSADIVYATDTTIEGNLDISRSQTVVLKNGVQLSVKGDATIGGTVRCEGGSLRLVVDGTLSADGALRCADGDVHIVARGPVAFSKEATVASSGSVQVVRDTGSLALDDAALEALYSETGEDSGAGTRIGPMIEGGRIGGGVSRKTSQTLVRSAFGEAALSFMNVAEAQTARDKEGNPIPGVVISGTWTVGEGGPPPSGVEVQTPDKKIKKIILNFAFGADRDVMLQNFRLVGPKGRSGESDEGKSCNAKGSDGENAFRFRVKARNITLDEFRLELGDGGDGGASETIKDCDPGIARGGNGGEAGNFKMTAEGEIRINSLHIVPGRGGFGGSAIAHGKDGESACPGKKGGDAIATGGDGGKNKKELAAAGAVQGIGNVTIDPVVGGYGGSAKANPGKGGNGSACKCAGGLGGKGTARGGQGGDASLSGISGASQGGDGGSAGSRGGTGGEGGMCALDQATGGNGGKGGDAKSTGGAGGKAQTDGADGEVQDETGGDGGNGGDGCGPGPGGVGGAGDPPGNPGNPGKRICTEPGSTTAPDTGTKGALPGGGAKGTPGQDGKDGTATGGSSGGAVKVVRAIQYQGKYLPVEELIVEDEAGCGADHWHAARGMVIATDGSQVFDPGPQCGYGKVSQTPTVTIETR